jgi:hypothetical protein
MIISLNSYQYSTRFAVGGLAQGSVHPGAGQGS